MRYVGSGITASSRFRCLYFREHQVELEVLCIKTTLCSMVPGSTIALITPFARRLLMPGYEFFCTNCKKLFSMVLSLVDYEDGDILCPHCGSKEVEQCWSAFSAIMSKKSA